jgi:hypothetical protein
MCRTRKELEVMIVELGKGIPDMIEAFPEPSDFWEAFDEKADPIEEAACSMDVDWVRQRIAILLMQYNVPDAPDYAG